MARADRRIRDDLSSGVGLEDDDIVRFAGIGVSDRGACEGEEPSGLTACRGSMSRDVERVDREVGHDIPNRLERLLVDDHGALDPPTVALDLVPVEKVATHCVRVEQAAKGRSPGSTT